MENLATYWEVEDQSSSTVDKVFSDGKNQYDIHQATVNKLK